MGKLPINFGHKAVNKKDGSTTDSWFPYVCGHCGREVSGAVIAYASLTESSSTIAVRWLQCPVCKEGSVHNDDGTFPGLPFGPTIQGLPNPVEEAYQEARRCLSVNANTAAEGLCRKILMHVAVDKGAKEGATFASYIDHLEQTGYVTPPMKNWVKLIKDHGNESQHRLSPPDRTRAESTLLFTAQLLRVVYEMEHMASQFTTKQ